VAEFVCNICGGKNSYSGEPFDRETPGCGSCGSNLRTRALIGALSTELFGIQLTLADFPRVKSWRGLGTSDSPQYAKRLAEVFDYRNTFYDREPRFDLGNSIRKIRRRSQISTTSYYPARSSSTSLHPFTRRSGTLTTF